MKKDLINKVLTAGYKAGEVFKKMSADEKTKLEETWDVEHAYYSSALEGSKLDRKEFEALAQETR